VFFPIYLKGLVWNTARTFGTRKFHTCKRNRLCVGIFPHVPKRVGLEHIKDFLNKEILYFRSPQHFLCQTVQSQCHFRCQQLALILCSMRARHISNVFSCKVLCHFGLVCTGFVKTFISVRLDPVQYWNYLMFRLLLLLLFIITFFILLIILPFGFEHDWTCKVHVPLYPNIQW
jgi:hypothetical protein